MVTCLGFRALTATARVRFPGCRQAVQNVRQLLRRVPVLHAPTHHASPFEPIEVASFIKERLLLSLGHPNESFANFNPL